MRSNLNPMDLSAILKKYASESNGQYTEYDGSHSILIVPVSGGRYQTVMGKIKVNELYNRQLLSFTSKVCAQKPGIDFPMLLEQSAHFNYCRFVIADGYIQVECVSALEGLNERIVREMVQEVANLADQYELKVTGTDLH